MPPKTQFPKLFSKRAFEIKEARMWLIGHYTTF
jgi:hypothetical protein